MIFARVAVRAVLARILWRASNLISDTAWLAGRLDGWLSQLAFRVERTGDQLEADANAIDNQ